MSERKKVVCIDDEPTMIDLVKFILGRKGFELTGAVGGREGLDAVRRVKPDLVLLDLMMSDMDGWEVYQQMKADEELRTIPVIVVSAKAQPIDVVLGLHIATVDDYVTKPFGPQELIGSVEDVLLPREEADRQKRNLNKEIQALTLTRNWLRERWEIGQADEKLIQLIDEFARLTSGAIHDLRSSIGAIKANVRILLKGMNEGDSWYRELKRIARAATYCELLIENLSEIRFKGEFQPRLLKLDQEFQKVLSLVRGKSPSVEFVYQSDDDLPTIEADAKQLRQAFLNLIRAILGTQTEASKVSIVVQTSFLDVQLKIIDIGQGIPSDKTFDLNAITKQGNYNVELYIAKKIIVRHGGRIDVKTVQEKESNGHIHESRGEPEKGLFRRFLAAIERVLRRKTYALEVTTTQAISEKHALENNCNLRLPVSQRLPIRMLREQSKRLPREIKKLEKKLKNRRSQGKVERLPQEINKLAGSVVGDLFSELGIVENTVGSMLRAMDQDDPLYERSFRVSRACEYCRLLSQNLLTLGTDKHPMLQPVDIKHVLDDVVKVLGNKILPNVEQTWDVDDAAPHVLGDELGLKQIFMNLVLNALEALPQDKPGKLQIKVKGEADWVVVDVIDNGCGIPPENQDRVFDLHFTTKPKEEGGIGLYVVQSVVDQLGGTMKMQSQPGQGAQFTVRLPAAKEA